MNAGDSGLRPVRRWRALLAHDAAAPTCDRLVEAVDEALGSVALQEASSVEGARVALRRGRFDLCFVCLDLPPVPHGAARIAEDVMASGFPLILVTRSLRWLPRGFAVPPDMPWIPPDADALAVSNAVGEAMIAFGLRASYLPGALDADDLFASR